MQTSLINRRLSTLREKLAERNLAGMLVTSLSNIRYLSGFTGSAATVLIAPDRQHFVSDGRYLEQSRRQVPDYERWIDSKPHLEVFKQHGLVPAGMHLAFEGDHLNVNQYHTLKSLFPDTRWEATTRIIEDLAAVKDATEIEALKTAVAITDRVFAEVLPRIQAGRTEKEIAAELRSRFHRYGDGEAFASIVAAGPNAALPHAVPGERPLQSGDFIIIDAGAVYAGYNADMTRTPVLGPVTDRHREIYAIVLEAQQAAIRVARAGLACKAVDAAARKHISERGYGEYFIHSTGHGLGLDVHTLPRFSQLSEDTLQANNVMTVEPGIYIPEWNGVRIEDDILIRPAGSEILNKTPRDLLVLA